MGEIMGDFNDSLNPSKIEGKEISKKSMIFAAIWISGLTLIKGTLYIFDKEFLSVGEIVSSGIAVVAVFSPIVMSVWLEKIKDIFDIRKQG
jgi:hypothetical protein